MTTQMTFLVVAVMACTGLHFSKRDSLTELVCATLAIAAVLAIPVGYLMGSF
ncbi:hypothetical protein KNT58_gp90 [Mycobacterium phage Fortunato]|uniref:Uncharacterized protein n=1 Tax=Mycobacterium phage Fortunato TaxID=1882439 RepID=A0A1D8EYM9_9CAUD|nr:hypothetical protein KNT58_gp90 [Mycobacterium phage Fortunato]AOT27321.1 hypothetical protein SEA_FORTUNATO_90 [Mycobacterium phage Fortunato]WNM65112.1 hypothetical protein SEA_MUDSLIDE_94 [Mycobacterium phage Mudslide]